MTVQNYQPEREITATLAAAEHIREQIKKSGHSHLRLGIKESGCNGYMYILDYIDGPNQDDQAFKIAGGMSLYVSKKDLPLVVGTTLEYITEGLNSSLQFKNPNATSHCGCGESFSIHTED
ncbi:MAG: iron-sulfur cluster assembly accessory protein [Gammaproteobacteria bacterium]|nr:iron-sulfur cluster assembly accessory protein [Gammaproteobacteria bacterium]|tara:strand:+ start:314 stop:676 length:363 start_codon:yes stop_codon:yes gene_type:complete